MSSAAIAATALAAALSAASVGTAQDEEGAVASTTTDVIVVRGQFIPQEKRNTSEISSLIDADDFTVRGDSDAAGALSRVTGLSISGGKFVFARGLNERYSSATLNGSILPSPEPLRRVAPLDLFPTSVLESVLAQKTYSPQYSAEFGGAMIDLRTIGVPDERFFEFGISSGFNSITQTTPGLLYDGSQGDWTGFDDGGRNRPAELSAIRGVQRVGELTGDERTAVSRSLDNDASYWLIQKGDINLDGAVNFSAGERFDLGPSIRVGFVASGGYSNQWRTREGIRGNSRLVGDELEAREQFDRFSTQNDIGLNGLLSVGVDLLDNHEIKGTLLGVRSTEKEARTLIGSAVEAGGRILRREHLQWLERQLWTSQVSGSSVFPALNDLKLEWRGSYSEAFRDAPYERYAEYGQITDGSFRYEGESSSNSTQFSYILDDTTDLGIDLSLPFSVAGIEAEINVGYAYTESDRAADVQTLRYSEVTSGALLDQRIDLIFSDANVFASGGLVLQEVGGALFPEAYAATLEVDAGYVQIDAQVTPNLRLAVGVRFEDAIEATDTFNLSDDHALNTVEGVIEEEHLLPAATLTWNVMNDIQLRLAYSQTITRPQFRELAPSIFVNSETDDQFFGNPYLVNAEITNYDARLEWYFDRDQFVTFGVFYKDLENPIEDILNEVGDGVFQTTFINAPAATLQGVEFEFERLFDMSEWFDSRFSNGKDAVLRTNYTYSHSEVDADGLVPVNIGTPLNPVRDLQLGSTRIVDGRQLQGQSEHLFNLQVGYEDYDARSRAMILVNFTGERIRSAENLSVPGGGLPAIVEHPPTTVDFVYSREFDAMGGVFELGFRAQNLLNDEYEAFQTRGGVSVPIDTYEIGRSFTVSLKARY